MRQVYMFAMYNSVQMHLISLRNDFAAGKFLLTEGAGDGSLSDFELELRTA